MITIDSLDMLTTHWPIFREGFANAQKLKKHDDATNLAWLMRAYERPSDQRLLLVRVEDGHDVGCGIAVECEGECWIYLAYCRSGVEDGIRPLLEHAKEWAVGHGYSKIAARNESLDGTWQRLFSRWGFAPRAIEYELKV